MGDTHPGGRKSQPSSSHRRRGRRPSSTASRRPALRRRPDHCCGGPSPGRWRPLRMGKRGHGQQHLALRQRAHTPSPGPGSRVPASQAPPCSAGIPGPARPARACILTGPELASVLPCILPPSLVQDMAPAAFPGPASLQSQPHRLLPMSSPFSRERAAFAYVTAPVPYSCSGGSGGGRSSSKRRGGAATFSTPRLPRPFPPPSQPNFRDRSRRVTGTALSGYHWLQGSLSPAQSREEHPGNPTCCGLVHFRREDYFVEPGC